MKQNIVFNKRDTTSLSGGAISTLVCSLFLLSLVICWYGRKYFSSRNQRESLPANRKELVNNPNLKSNNKPLAENTSNGRLLVVPSSRIHEFDNSSQISANYNNIPNGINPSFNDRPGFSLAPKSTRISTDTSNQPGFPNEKLTTEGTQYPRAKNVLDEADIAESGYSNHHEIDINITVPSIVPSLTGTHSKRSNASPDSTGIPGASRSQTNTTIYDNSTTKSNNYPMLNIPLYLKFNESIDYALKHKIDEGKVIILKNS